MKLKITSLLLLASLSIIELEAQNYLLNFTGSGGSLTVATVKVENLTKGTSKLVSGSDVLRLINIPTGVETINQTLNNQISFSPNPMTDYSRMQFDLREAGNTMIYVYDISGRKIAETQDILSKGKHTFRIQGLTKGIYAVMINSRNYSNYGRLVSTSSIGGSAKIQYENTDIIQDSNEDASLAKEKDSSAKGTNAEIQMQYSTGDRLKMTGTYNNYSTVVMDVPTASKIVTFNFVACTDGDNNNYPVVQIGTQLWMAKNLNTKVYANGNPIGTTTSTDISGETTPKYQWAYGDVESVALIYGRLYTFYTLTDIRGVCPTGWHVPSDPEFSTLHDYLANNGFAFTPGDDDIAKSLASSTGYAANAIPGNIGNDMTSNNSTGFSALPGGFRKGNDGTWNLIGLNGYWGSSTEGLTPGNSAWYRALNYNDRILGRNDFGPWNGYSVRCVK